MVQWKGQQNPSLCSPRSTVVAELHQADPTLQNPQVGATATTAVMGVALQHTTGTGGVVRLQ